MTTPTPPIEIPRRDGESARAYDARVRYVTMGAGRSIDKVGQQLGSKSATPPGHITRWSQQYAWVESARAYDEAMAARAAAVHAERYLADLEEHRQRYGTTGKALHGVAVNLLNRLRADPEAAESLSTIARALTIAADLEAHALRIADLLPKLDAGGGDV